MKRVVLIGCGNITNLRHLPALKSLQKECEVLGVIGLDGARTNSTARLAATSNVFIGDLLLQDPPDWLKDADLVIIGTPPMTHLSILNRVLSINDRCQVLVEKPFSLGDVEDELMRQVSIHSSRIFVMHNFQFSNGMKKVSKWIENGRIGSIKAINGVQLSTKSRRLPVWHEDLPLGLFWDESAHFIYLVRRLLGEVVMCDANALQADINTPQMLSMNMRSTHGVPVNIMMNFESSVSEWGLVISGTQGVAIYDFFRDISIFLPHDQEHLAKHILRTSALSVLGHIRGFLVSGFMLTVGKLHYGVDHVIRLALHHEEDHPDRRWVSLEAAIECVALMQAVHNKLRDARPS